MLHEKGKKVSSFSFPNSPQFPIPGHALPPPKIYMSLAVSNRGHPQTGSRERSRQRGKPFSIVWSSPDNCPLATFGNTGSYLLRWMDFITFQTVKNHGDPLRHTSTLLAQYNKTHAH